MLKLKKFSYKPIDSENEKASYAYVMSVIAIMVGLPLPIVNLLATFIFYLGNRSATHFVRWHTTQALLSQFSLLFVNSAAFWWTIDIFFRDGQVSNLYISYIVTILIVNFAEFVVTIYTAGKVRKGQHIEWYFYGPLTNTICKS